MMVKSVALATINAPIPSAERVKNTAFVDRIPKVAMKPMRNPCRMDKPMTSNTAGPGESESRNSVSAKKCEGVEVHGVLHSVFAFGQLYFSK